MRVLSWIAAPLVLMVLTLATPGCNGRATVSRNPALVLQLRWVKGYPRETKGKVETGLSWALSFLGASMPVDAEPFSWRGNVLTIDLDAAGVLSRTRPAWIGVLNAMKSSDEYRLTGAIDIGRFLVLTLCSSHQYFALTGAASTFADFQATHRADWRAAAIVESDIAYGNRLLQISSAARIEDIAFIAFEGNGAIANASFNKAEIETIDFMPNGQLRFALFDLQGGQKSAATSDYTAAGKPSKCLWCHEINLQPPFRNTTSVPGYYSATELRAVILERTRIVDAYRKTLKSKIDFSRTQDHTYAELLYLSFSHPNLQRLASEWALSEDEVKTRVRGLKVHRLPEFPFLGDELYDRDAVEALAPVQGIRGPSDLREASAYEPDLVTSSLKH